jgi:hypothetical protein
MTQVPHFDLPFRLVGSCFAANEQGSIDDIANCVEMIFRVHVGWRRAAPGFGSPDLLFRKLPIGVNQLLSIVTRQEPRADYLINEYQQLDDLIDRINVIVSRRGIVT